MSAQNKTRGEPTTGSVRDRRGEYRVAANKVARIRDAEFKEELAYVENLSRSGVCFASSRDLQTGSTIEIAVLDSPNSPSVFVPARIVWRREVTGQKLIKYGAIYPNLTRADRL